MVDRSVGWGGRETLGPAGAESRLGRQRVVEMGRDVGLGRRDAAASQTGVRGVGVVPEVSAVGPNRRDAGGARAHERVQYDILGVGVQVDQAGRELDGKRSRVADARRALGREFPHIGGEVQELVAVDGGDRRQTGPGAALLLHRTIEPALGRDDDPLAEIAQHRVGRLLERPPRAVAARSPGLHPDDLAPEEQLEAVLEDVGDIARE